MANTNGLITIDHVVKSYFNEKGQSIPENYLRYKQIIIEGYTDLNIHNTTYVEKYIGKVNEVNQMALPPDLINWISVNTEVNGELWPLDINDKLIIPYPNDCGNVVTFPSHFNIPEIKGMGYTRRRRNIAGEFNIDVANRVIAFKGDFRNKNIYLYYISSGISQDTTTYISRAYLPLLKAYLNWVIKERDDSVPMAQKQRAEYLYGLELQKLENFNNSLSADEILAIIRDGYTQGVKS